MEGTIYNVQSTIDNVQKTKYILQTHCTKYMHVCKVQSTMYIRKSTKYKVQCTDVNRQSTEYKVQSTDPIVQSTEYRVQCQCTKCNVQCKDFPGRTEYRFQCTEYKVQTTKYSCQSTHPPHRVQYTSYNVQRIKFNVQILRTECKVQCTMYNVHCASYNVRNFLGILRLILHPHCTDDRVQCTDTCDKLQRTRFNVQIMRTEYKLQSTINNVQCK